MSRSFIPASPFKGSFVGQCLTLSVAAALSLGACTTVPDPEPVEEKVVVIVPEVHDTCTPISALTRVEIPAETEIYYGITEIDNPPYEPIQRKEKLTREVKPAEVFYVDSEGKEVLDLCDSPLAGPVPEDMEGFDDLGDAAQPEMIGGPQTVQEVPVVNLDPDG